MQSRVQYPAGALHRGSQTGMAILATYPGGPTVECPCGVFHPTATSATVPLAGDIPRQSIKKPAGETGKGYLPGYPGRGDCSSCIHADRQRSAKNEAGLPETSVSPVAVSTVCGLGTKTDIIAGRLPRGRERA